MVQIRRASEQKPPGPPVFIHQPLDFPQQPGSQLRLVNRQQIFIHRKKSLGIGLRHRKQTDVVKSQIPPRRPTSGCRTNVDLPT